MGSCRPAFQRCPTRGCAIDTPRLVSLSLSKTFPHLVALTEGKHLSIVQHEHRIQGCERARPMRDDDDDRLTLAQYPNRASQSRFSLSVEVRIRFVEHHHK